MEHGPLPPHERSWRHPSELGPTRADVEVADAGDRSAMFALAGGTLAVLAVATMVVAMTPRTSPGPIALSATTTPIVTRTAPPTDHADQIADRSLDLVDSTAPRAQSLRLGTGGALLATFAAFPHSVTRVQQFDLDGTAVADEVPDADDTVLVRTEAVTYEMHWAQATSMTAPDGSVVFDTEGRLLAHVEAGELITLVDD